MYTTTLTYSDFFFCYGTTNRDDASINDLLDAVCKVTGLSRQAISQPTRNRERVLARQLFCGAARRMLFGYYSLSEVGIYVNLTHSTVVANIRAFDRTMRLTDEVSVIQQKRFNLVESLLSITKNVKK